MKKVLIMVKTKLYHVKNGITVVGAHADIRGDVSDIWGDVSDIQGDIDAAEIADEERKNGIDIIDLVKTDD